MPKAWTRKLELPLPLSSFHKKAVNCLPSKVQRIQKKVLKYWLKKDAEGFLLCPLYFDVYLGDEISGKCQCKKGLKGAKIAFQTSAILHLLIILDLSEQAWCMGLEILHFDWTGKEIFETHISFSKVTFVIGFRNWIDFCHLCHWPLRNPNSSKLGVKAICIPGKMHFLVATLVNY